MGLDTITANAGSGGSAFVVDPLVSASAGSGVVPFTKLMSGTSGENAVIPGDATNGLFVQVKTSALPSGAATGAKQDTGNASIASAEIHLAVLAAAVSADLVEATIISSALPSGAATAAKQDTGNASLASINAYAAILAGAVSADLVEANIVSSALPTGAATSARQDTGNASLASIAANTATLAAAVSADLVEANVIGNVAHDAADAGNPVKIGGKALASLKTATLVASADRIDSIYDLDGAQMVRGLCPFGDLITERRVDSGGASTNLTTFNGSTSVRNYITAITVSNSNASLDGTVDFRNGSAGTIFWTCPAPHAGGAHLTFDPPLRQLSIGVALAVDVSAAIPDVTICVNGFQSKL